MSFAASPISIDHTTHPPTAQVTAIVFAYNQEKVAVEAAQSLLNQTIVPAEIILSDDCSTDGTFEAFQQFAQNYTGPAKIRARRNQTNQRFIGHIHAAVADATHDWMLVSAGDDVSLPHRLETFLEYQATHPQAAFLWADIEMLSFDGKISPSSGLHFTRESFVKHEAGVGPNQFWHKTLFSCFDPIPNNVKQEDEILPFRARLLGKALPVPHKTLLWRQRPNETHHWGISDAQAHWGDEFRLALIGCAFTPHITTACKLADLRKFIADHPERTDLFHKVEKLEQAVQQAVCNHKMETIFVRMHQEDIPLFNRLFLGIKYCLLGRCSIRTLRFFIVHVLRAPASLEEKIGGRKVACAIAAMGALALAWLVAWFVFQSASLQKNEYALPILAGTLTFLCTYPFMVLLLRTIIVRICVGTPQK